MEALGLHVREVQETVRACAHIRIPDPAPEYLSQFLVARLKAKNPALATRVEKLDAAQMQALFRLIRSLQHIGRDE